MRKLFVMFIFLQRFLLAACVIILCVAPVVAATNDPGVSSSLMMNQSTDSTRNISMAINNDWFAGDFTKLTSLNKTTTEHNDIYFKSVREYFEDITDISLHKGSDQAVWSLTTSFGKYSLNPINGLKNFQVFLRYKF